MTTEYLSLKNKWNNFYYNKKLMNYFKAKYTTTQPSYTFYKIIFNDLTFKEVTHIFKYLAI